MFVKYASLLLQAITVEIDEAFLYAILDLTRLEGVSWESNTEKYGFFNSKHQQFKTLKHLLLLQRSYS